MFHCALRISVFNSLNAITRRYTEKTRSFTEKKMSFMNQPKTHLKSTIVYLNSQIINLKSILSFGFGEVVAVVFFLHAESITDVDAKALVVHVSVSISAYLTLL